MNIFGKKVVLRAIEERDLEDLQKWSNDPAIQRQLGGWHFPVSEQDQKRWFSAFSFNSLDQRFAVVAEGDKLIGTANLISIDWQNRNAFHGLMIGDPGFRGKGYALDAVMTLMRLAFDEMGLYRLDGAMIEYNVASLKFYLEKCGWKKEGVKQGWYYRNEQRWDKIVVGITKDDYKEHCKTSGYWEKQ